METGKKVLIVDDDEALVRLIDQVLTQKGYEVLKTSNGQEALRLLFDQRPDLVLLDVVMPRMDGWQTLDRIRDVSDIPVIILTGKRRAEEDIVRGLDCGADDYLLKPVGNRELVARQHCDALNSPLQRTQREKLLIVMAPLLWMLLSERSL